MFNIFVLVCLCGGGGGGGGGDNKNMAKSFAWVVWIKMSTFMIMLYSIAIYADNTTPYVNCYWDIETGL